MDLRAPLDDVREPVDEPVGRDRRSRTLSPAAVALVVSVAVMAWRVVASGWLIIGAGHSWLVGSVPDDAYYYLEIAARIGRGDGATFDGVHATNGFHPLWQAMVAGLSLGFSGDTLVKAALILELACLVAAVIVVARLLSRRFGTWAACATLLVGASPALIPGGLDGMESGVSLLSLALLAAALDRHLRVEARRSALLLGVCCGLVVVARLDFATVIWIVPAALVFRGGRWRRALEVCVGAAATVAPYVAWNLFRFGHLLSVSGTRKLQMMDAAVQTQFGSRLSSGYLHLVSANLDSLVSEVGEVANPGKFFPVPVVSVVALVGLIAWTLARVPLGRTTRGAIRSVRRGSVNATAFACVVVCTVVVVKSAVALVVLPTWSTGWYAAPLRLAGGVAVAVGAVVTVQKLVAMVDLPGSRGWLGVLAVVAVVVVLGSGSPVRPGSSSGDAPQGLVWQSAIDETAHWLAAHPQRGRYGAYDAGLLGYELDPRPVVNLDGLVNDYAYERLVSDPAVSPLRRLEHEKVKILIGRFGTADQRLPGCAARIWASRITVPYTNGVTERSTRVPVGVFDLSKCP